MGLKAALKLGWLAALVLATVPAQAISFDVNPGLCKESTDNCPPGEFPWVSANFNDTDTGEVTLTMTADLTDGMKIGAWYFNFDNLLTGVEEDPGILEFVAPLDSLIKTITTGVDSLSADGAGLFDIKFSFETSGGNNFGGTDVVTVVIRCDVTELNCNGFDASWFNITDATGKDEIYVDHVTGVHVPNPYRTAVHIQGIPCTSTDDSSDCDTKVNGDTVPCPAGEVCDRSTWIAGVGPPSRVPEPSTLALVGMGLVGLGIVRRARRRQSKRAD